MTARTLSRRAAFGGTTVFARDLRATTSSKTVHLSGLRWTGAHPAFPVFHGAASGGFAGAIAARVAMRVDPLRYKAYLAFSRLASVLGRHITPPTDVFSVRLPVLLGAVEGDPRGRSLLRDAVAVLNDGTVTVLVSDAVRGREVDFAGWELRAARNWAEASAPVPRERQTLVGAYVDTLVLDYLAGNVRRTTVLLPRDGPGIWAVENSGAFVERVEPAALDGVLVQLKRIARFSRSLVERLARVERADFEAALHAGPFASWLVATRPINEMLERSRVVQSLVAARTAQSGAERTLGLP